MTDTSIPNAITTSIPPTEKSFRARRFLSPFETATGKVQWLGIVVLALIALAAIFAPFITPYGPKDLVCAPFEGPSPAHISGCNDAGQDIFTQLLFGARISLSVGLLVAAISTAVATLLAITAGFYGGWADRVIMRFVDVVLSLPFLPLVIVLGVFFGSSIQTQVLVIALVMWSQPVRELRAQILSIRASGFVEAALSMGAGGWFVGTRHILPELAPLIVPQFVRIAHGAILVETSLSFLGLGDPLQNSWGSILFHANARTAFLTGTWVYWIVPPGIAVSLTVLALAFIGFGYDASLAPRIKARKGEKTQRPEGVVPDKTAILSVRSLRVSYDSEFGSTEVVKNIDLTLRPGELLGLVGESGSGKTTLALAILRLLRSSARVTHGVAWLDDQDLLTLDEKEVRKLRGRRLALIPQSAMNALNPVLSIGAQLGEALDRGEKLTSDDRQLAIGNWLEKVGLTQTHAQSFPHELSGGMRQRAVIAIALCNNPDVVIADEPTTGLDVLVQEEIMGLLLSLRQNLNLSILFVTHNLPLIARHADRIAVMYDGEVVDEGTALHLRTNPGHIHTRALFESLPELTGEKRWPSDTDNAAAPLPVIALSHVNKVFQSRRILGQKSTRSHQALKQVSLQLAPGEKLGLVGGSGAGKSTIARLIMGIIKPDEGSVMFNGVDVRTLDAKARQKMIRAVHMVFQDPYNSMRNGMQVREIVAEPLHIQGIHDEKVINARVRVALEATHLPSDGHFMSRLPVALSGGQRQRIAFARAIITEPKVIIADEPTSMLDQSVRMEIMELMENLKQNFGTAFLFVTHDIALARHFCDRLIVLKDGEIVEEGVAERVVHQPFHAYTRALIAAV